MLYNSIPCLIFLPIVLIIYWLFYNKVKYQNIILLLASYLFYSWWDWRFLSLIVISSITDFFLGKAIYNTTKPFKRKQFLFISLLVNLGILVYFKYANFFIESFVNLFSTIGVSLSIKTLNLILPVGISFYTFQTLSYTIDIYRKKIAPTKDAISFFTFVAFFPQLVAGPIERASNLLPQFSKKRTLLYKNFSKGIKLIIFGFFLKLVVADRAGIYVDAVYNNINEHQGFTFLFSTILFAFQIYGDFSGYSLIAIGTAKLFNFDLMTNFKRPYLALSVSEFWKRWHISLSTWFKDYVYIPLGGNRTKKYRWYLNLFLTFLISGLWHGANWTFVVWGGLNGLYLIIEIILQKRKAPLPVIRILITFMLINFSWIFFRSNSITDSVIIIQKIFTQPGNLYIGSGDDIAASIYAVIAISCLVILEIKNEYLKNLFKVNSLTKLIGYAFLIFIILYVGVFDESQFIYFQF